MLHSCVGHVVEHRPGLASELQQQALRIEGRRVADSPRHIDEHLRSDLDAVFAQADDKTQPHRPGEFGEQFQVPAELRAARPRLRLLPGRHDILCVRRSRRIGQLERGDGYLNPVAAFTYSEHTTR